MTTEKLSKAKEIDSEIKSLVKIKNALNSPYVNQIKCINFSGDKENTETFTVDNELKEIIDAYLSQKIDALEKEFEEL